MFSLALNHLFRVKGVKLNRPRSLSFWRGDTGLKRKCLSLWESKG